VTSDERTAWLTKAVALGRHGALTRDHFGKPRGTRTEAATRKEPVPGHYYPKEERAQFIVPNEPLHLDAYIHILRTSEDPEVRHAAVHVLEEFGDASCIAPLDCALHDERVDEATRCQAACALACLGSPTAEESLWRALECRAYPKSVREAGAYGLLDLLTPDGWDSYQFMNSFRAVMPNDVRARFQQVIGDLDWMNILDWFDTEPS